MFRFFTDIFLPDYSRGFLPKIDPLITFSHSSNLQIELLELAKNLPSLMKHHQLRSAIDALNKKQKTYLSTEKELILQSPEEKQLAILILTMLTSAYIWQNPKEPVNLIPEVLGHHLQFLCKSMQRFPILSYSDYILNNFKRIDDKSPLTLENIEPIFTFTDTIDEKWFIKIHLMIEITCAPAIHAILEACILHYQNKINEKKLITLLTENVAKPLKEASYILIRMKEHCQPDFFYHTIRPLLSGWDEKLQVHFEGNKKTFYQYKGASGAQSSILPALDAALGIEHDINEMFQHLLTFTQYMPLKHQYFIHLLKLRCIRLSSSSSEELINALDQVTQEIKRFRYMHLYAIVKRFIDEPSEHSHTKGTGGTPISNYLSSRHMNTVIPRSKL